LLLIIIKSPRIHIQCAVCIIGIRSIARLSVSLIPRDIFCWFMDVSTFFNCHLCRSYPNALQPSDFCSSESSEFLFTPRFSPMEHEQFGFCSEPRRCCPASSDGMIPNNCDLLWTICWTLCLVSMYTRYTTRFVNGGHCFLRNVWYTIKKVKLSLQQAVEVQMVVRRRGSHIF
jgi:hypothetical protein